MPDDDKDHDCTVAVPPNVQGIRMRKVSSEIAQDGRGVGMEDLPSDGQPGVQDTLAARTGPFYDEAGIQSWLGIDDELLLERREKRLIIGCRTQDGHWVYPVWQFQHDGSLVPGLAQVLAILARGIDDGWTWSLWLLSRASGLPSDKSVIQWLREGEALNCVLRLAREDASAWAG